MELATAIASAKATLELVLLAAKARDAAKLEAATLELRSQLFAMSDIAMAYIEKNVALVTSNAALQEANAEHVRAIAELEQKLVERERYALHELRPGAFVYSPKASQAAPDQSAMAAHYLCQPCYDKGLKAVLRFHPARTGTDAHYTCPEGGMAHTIALPGTALALEPSRTISRGLRDW